jgi:hypothetical protein
MLNNTNAFNCSFIHKIDLIAAGLVALCGLIIIVVSYFFNVHQYSVGIVLILAPSIYILLRKNNNIFTQDIQLKTSRNTRIISFIVFLFAFSGSLLILHNNLYYRPPIYFFLIAIAATSIAVTIITNKGEKGLALISLFQIMLLTLSVRIGIFYEFPSLMGSDTWFHLNFASFIADYGNIPNREVFDAAQYKSFPIGHILIAITKILTATNLKDAAFYSLIFPGVVSVLVMYFFGKNVAGVKVGLFGALIFAFADMILQKGVTNISIATLVIWWFLLILLLLYKKPRTPAFLFLVIIVFWAMILTHQLTVFASLMAFLGLLGGKVAYDILYKGFYRKQINPNMTSGIFIIFLTSLLFYWMNFGDRVEGRYFFDTMVIRFLNNLSGDLRFIGEDTPYAGLAGEHSFLSNTLYQGGYLILLFFAVIGALIWLSSKNCNSVKFGIITGIVVLYIFIYGFTLTNLAMVVIPHRWLPFAYVLLIPLTAQGLLSVCNTIKFSWGRLALGTGLAFILIFFMVTTPYITNGSAIYNQDRDFRSGYKISELEAATTIVELYQGDIMIDRGYRRPFSQATTPEDVNTISLESDLDVSFAGLLLLRQDLKTHPTQISTRGTFGRIRSAVLGQEYFDMVESLPHNGIIYNNGEVIAYSFTAR